MKCLYVLTILLNLIDFFFFQIILSSNIFFFVPISIILNAHLRISFSELHASVDIVKKYDEIFLTILCKMSDNIRYISMCVFFSLLHILCEPSKKEHIIIFVIIRILLPLSLLYMLLNHFGLVVIIMRYISSKISEFSLRKL